MTQRKKKTVRKKRPARREPSALEKQHPRREQLIRQQERRKCLEAIQEILDHYGFRLCSFVEIVDK